MECDAHDRTVLEKLADLKDQRYRKEQIQVATLTSDSINCLQEGILCVWNAQQISCSVLNDDMMTASDNQIGRCYPLLPGFVVPSDGYQGQSAYHQSRPMRPFR